MITQKKSEYLSESRIKKWFSEVANLCSDDIGTLNDPHRVYNIDETAFFLASDGSLVLAECGKSVYNISLKLGKENITVSICANAAGEYPRPLIVYAYDRLPTVHRSMLPDN